MTRADIWSCVTRCALVYGPSRNNLKTSLAGLLSAFARGFARFKRGPHQKLWDSQYGYQSSEFGIIGCVCIVQELPMFLLVESKDLCCPVHLRHVFRSLPHVLKLSSTFASFREKVLSEKSCRSRVVVACRAVCWRPWGPRGSNGSTWHALDMEDVQYKPRRGFSCAETVDVS